MLILLGGFCRLIDKLTDSCDCIVPFATENSRLLTRVEISSFPSPYNTEGMVPHKRQISVGLFECSRAKYA